MKKLLFFGVLLLSATQSIGQIVTTNPAIPRPDQPVTITIDVSGTSLDHYGWNNSTAPVWAWVWIEEGCSSGCDAPTNVNPATSPAQDAAKATRISTNPDIYQITFTPTTFLNKPASQLQVIGIKLKTRSWDDQKQTDNNRYITLSQSFSITFSQPAENYIFVNNGQNVPITVNTNEDADITLKINGATVASVSDGQQLQYSHVVAQASGTVDVEATADNGTEEKTDSFVYIVRSVPVVAPRPPGVVDGINYRADASKVILSFLAPLKNNCYVIGDFNDWQPSSEYQMKKEGEHFWLEITGLVSGQEYAFQYLVDETMAVADPFADKVLDPGNDQYITAATYPDLKPYPERATGIVSVLQTAQVPYVWQTTGYSPPSKEKLNVYELLVRDFDTPRTYQAVIDKLDYLSDLGINAIELMPIMEFSGNDSWGYNPIFYFGVDKAYGTKNKLKELVDKAHARGIAVILDMVLNQADYEFPYVKMYWAGNKPAANNPWFNTDARHPFSVFFDFNHESQYTKNLVDTINHYWLTEFKFDGFRFDLSKGFTQNFTSDVNIWGNYDQSRVDILTRMANKIWSHHPEAYVILEHLGSDSEERVLANNGMTLWGIMTEAYKQNSLGFGSSSDISRTYYKNRSGSPWNNPASVIAYMESHDEERMMYNNLQFGNSAAGYNVKLLKTALDREKAAFSFFLTIPGPKMIWQFGELGYDVSINENGRTGAKPVRWSYFDNADRKKLYKTVAELFKLRNTYEIFHTSDVQINGGGDLYKHIILKHVPYNPNPSTATDMNVVVVGNFNVTAQSRDISFPHTGNWYHYFSPDDVLTIGQVPISLQLQPGEFRIYTDVPLPAPEPELVPYVSPIAPTFANVEQVGGVVLLTWIDNSQVETGFKIFRKKSSEPVFIEVGEVGEGVSTFTDSEVEALTEYDYYVQAFNPVSSSNSQELSVTTNENVITDVDGELDRLSIYPNPVNDYLHVNLPDNRIYDIQIFDEFGRTVLQITLHDSKLRLSGLTPGLYFLKVVGKKSNKYFRFIKI